MTCIAGVVQDNKVYIGADSAGVANLSLIVRADRKVFRNGEFVMGFTSSFRMGQLLRYSFIPPKRHVDSDVDKFMATDFIDAVRNCLKAGGYAEKHAESERAGVFLVGYAGRLFRIECDYQVGEALDGYDAIGCGGEVALGALFATLSHPPRERLEIALRAAERFSAGVRAPFHYETT
jgi:ATP-dependent protease HslVU (ClpYQ) peptidase subunit